MLWSTCTLEQIALVADPERRQHYASKARDVRHFKPLPSNQLAADLPPFDNLHKFVIRPPKSARWVPPHYLPRTLRSLGLVSGTITKRSLYLLAKHFPHLEQLFLDTSASSLLPQDLATFLKYRTKLRILALGSDLNTLIDGKVLYQLGSSSSLRTLEFMQSINASLAKHLTMSCPMFSTFEILSLTIDAAALQYLAPHLQRIRSLTLRLNDEFPTGLRFLSTLETLEELNIRLFHKDAAIDEPELAAFQELKKLRRFKLYTNHKTEFITLPLWSDARMLAYLSGFARLECFDMSHLLTARKLHFSAEVAMLQYEGIDFDIEQVAGKYESAYAYRWIPTEADVGWERDSRIEVPNHVVRRIL
ncbi:hypothetical protein ANO11243_042230 [Dothideomycetidae sp. 11243]|nr:hypothetical protein ANO11243_042230 [fungal sp. No.11243]